MPIQRSLDALEKTARLLGKRIARSLPKNMGFCLVLYDFGGDGHMTYIANGKRQDVLNLLHELQTKLGGHN